MQDPSELYRFETDTDRASARASVMLVSMGGFIDAGRTRRLLTEHLPGRPRPHRRRLVRPRPAPIPRPPADDDLRARPVATSYEDPSLLLYRLTDRDGHPFLLLAGAEPGYQWERMVEAVMELGKALGVDLTVSVHGIPMAVPHTRRWASRRTPPTPG